MFIGNTDLRRIDSNTYMLLSQLTYRNNYIIVDVKEGFLTDGASIPRFFWSIVGCPMNGRYVGSAIIHDALYASQLLSRDLSDLIFLDMLEENGVNKFKRFLMYISVKYFGAYRWGRVPNDEIENSRKLVQITRR